MAKNTPTIPKCGNDAAAVLIEVSQGYAVMGDRRRAIAFANAADSFKERYGLADVSTVTVHDLKRLPNVGAGSAETIVQIVKTGTCDRLKMIRAQGIPSLADLFRVRGIGPATAKVLWFDYKIATVADLRTALVKRKIRNESVLNRINKISLDLQKEYGGHKKFANGDTPFLLASDFIGECDDLRASGESEYNWMAVLTSGL